MGKFLSEVINDFHIFYNHRTLQNNLFDGLRKSYFLGHAEEMNPNNIFFEKKVIIPSNS